MFLTLCKNYMQIYRTVFKKSEFLSRYVFLAAPCILAPLLAFIVFFSYFFSVAPRPMFFFSVIGATEIRNDNDDDELLRKTLTDLSQKKCRQKVL